VYCRGFDHANGIHCDSESGRMEAESASRFAQTAGDIFIRLSA